MRVFMARWAAAAGLAIALSGPGEAQAQSVMKVCADQYSQAKASGATNESWPQFLQHCKAQQSGAAAPPPAAPPPAAPAPAPASTTTASSPSVYKQCQADWSQAKASGATQGQSWQQYLAGCKARREAAAAPRPWWMPAPAAPAPTATAPAPAPQPAATGAGEFTTAAQAKARCPLDLVVWVNTKSSIYHYPGAHRYGNTLHGAYMCEADAKATGDRAAMNEQHP